MENNIYDVTCGWGVTRAKLQRVDKGIYYWVDLKDGFKFISSSLDDCILIESEQE